MKRNTHVSQTQNKRAEILSNAFKIDSELDRIEIALSVMI